jgi:hypothetical protein
MSLYNLLLVTASVIIGQALSGCASSMAYLGRNSPPQEVPVAAVVNAIKCEVNDVFYEQQKMPQKRAFRLKLEKSALSKIKLNLRVARGGGLALSQINVTGTPLQALVSFSPNAHPLAAGASVNSTIGVEVSIIMEQTANRSLDCNTRKVVRTKGLVLKDWLTKLIDQGQDQIMSDGPATRLSEIVLTTNFEVGATVGLSPAIAIIPTANASTSYTNQLQITLKGDSEDPGGTLIGGGNAKALPSNAKSTLN